jgi:hypothetical protein
MMNTKTSAEPGTAQASRIADATYFYVRVYCGENPSKPWKRLREFLTLNAAEEYLRDCIRGNGVMALENPIRVKYQIIKAVATREVMKTWEGDIR